MNVTPEQIQQLQEMVSTLVADRSAANDATAASGQAHADLQVAQTKAAAADADEAARDAKVDLDLQGLRAFIDGLAGPAPTPTPAAPAP